jgi:hypothetical protein
MLASFLKTGQSVDFALTNAIPDHMPNIELRVYDDTSQRVGSIILMPTEAITLAEHLQQLVEHVATHITQHIQEETSDDKGTRRMDGDVQLGDERRQTRSLDRDGENETSGHRTVAPANQENGNPDMPMAQRRSDPDGVLTSLHPRAAKLLAGAGLDNNGNHAPAHYNVEIDDSWSATITDEPELSATLMPTKQQIAAAEANLKRRQDEVNDFVSWLHLVPRKPNDALSSRSYFDVTVSCENNPWDEAVMPIAVDSHPWVRSKAMREVILSAFRQGFQYGVNWEESRNEGEL